MTQTNVRPWAYCIIVSFVMSLPIKDARAEEECPREPIKWDVQSAAKTSVEGDTFPVIVEISAGMLQKWEADKSLKFLAVEKVDGACRRINYLGYPANYGFIINTMLSTEDGGDGDPIDAFVLGDPIHRGTLINARPIGVIKMLDHGARDDKVITVPNTNAFRQVDSLKALEALYPGSLTILQTWLENYKGRGLVSVEGTLDKATALKTIEQASGTNNR